MKPWIILIVLAVALTAAFTLAMPFLSSVESASKTPSYPAPAKPDGPAPVAEVEGNLTYNFGILPQRSSGRHTWIFKNSGAGPLELRGAHKTCSCTTAALFGADNEKRVKIEPGASLPIEVTFETKTFEGTWGQAVTVGTNDPLKPTIVLRVEGTLKPAVSSIPADPALSYGVVSNEDEILRKVVFFSADRPDLKVFKVTASNPALLNVSTRPLTAEEAKGISVEKGHVVEVKLRPSANLGAFAEEVLVETDHPLKAEVRFKVTGKLTGIVALVPEKVTVRGATASDGGSESILLLVRGRETVQFTVDRKPASLDIAIVPIAPVPGAKGSKYRMVVKVVPGTESGRITDEIVLKTDDPKASEVKIPVDILVQGSR